MATIGTDPELFVGVEGSIRAVCGRLGGTKGRPLVIEGGYGLQEDNVMLEYNIKPATAPNEFANSVTQGLEAVLAYARDRMGPEIQPLRAAEILVPGDQLSHPLAQTFGCSQDYDAHSRGEPAARVDPRSLEESTGAWRFAGGHVHMGYDNPNGVPPFVVAALADVVLGLPSLMDGDLQQKRRGLYGQAGRFRPTPYGIEYRVLSNYWIWDWHLALMVGDRALRLAYALERMPMATLQRWYKETPWNDVRSALEHNNSQLASDLYGFLINEVMEDLGQ